MSQEPEIVIDPTVEPEALDPRARRAEILALRSQLLAGKSLSEEEIRRGLLLIRADRASSSSGAGKSKTSKKEVSQLSLSDF